jgi:regulator of cell morphogenesis and NO signaling
MARAAAMARVVHRTPSMTPTTLAHLAATRPAASRVFRRHRLDFCCGGQRFLTEVCADRALDPEAILREIETETVHPDDPASMLALPVAAIVPHIVERYHEPLRRELPELIALATKVERVHADKGDCPHGLAAHLELMQADILTHLAKEEQVLFPMILDGAGPRTRGPITVILREHDDHGDNLKKLRALAHDFAPPEAACTTWRALYLRLEEFEGELMDHIALENNVLFPKALNPEARAAS